MNPLTSHGASHGSSPPRSRPQPGHQHQQQPQQQQWQPHPPLPRPPPPLPSTFDEPIPANLRRGSSKRSHKPKTLMPAVIWDDRQSSSENQATFYSEGTPPSTPSLQPHHSNHSGGGTGSGGGIGVGGGGYPYASSIGDEIGGSSSYGGGGAGPGSARKEEVYDYKYDRVAPPAPIPERTKFGLKRKTFWIVVAAAAILVVIIALAVGLGVGLSSKKGGSSEKSGDNDGAASDHSSTDEPTSTTTESATTVTESLVGPTYTSSPSQACPAANNTVFDVPESDASFRRFCGRDYRDGKGAEDVGVVWTASVIDCMVNCAGYPGCKGVGWGFIAGDKGDNHRCWMKKDIKEGEWESARAGWDFAILVD